MQMIRKFCVVGAIGLALSMPASADEISADTVIATVNGNDITLGNLIVARNSLPEEYQAMPDKDLYDGLLTQTIQQMALASEMPKEGSKLTAITLDNYRTSLMAGEVLAKVAETAVTPEALQAAYDARYADAEPEREYNAAHILVTTEEEAKAIKEELEAGAAFADVAKEKSTGPSGPNGGDLGWFSKGMMVKPFEDAVISLEPGEISDPVQTQFGWHVLILNDTRLKSAPDLEEVTGELSSEIERAAVEARIAEVEASSTIERADVEIDPAILKDLSLITD